jgi:hypothetical protein
MASKQGSDGVEGSTTTLENGQSAFHLSEVSYTILYFLGLARLHNKPSFTLIATFWRRGMVTTEMLKTYISSSRDLQCTPFSATSYR